MKKEIVFDLNEDEVEVEDGGMAKIVYVPHEEETGIAVTLTSYEEEDEPQHEEINQLIGKKVKITIEVL